MIVQQRINLHNVYTQNTTNTPPTLLHTSNTPQLPQNTTTNTPHHIPNTPSPPLHHSTPHAPIHPPAPQHQIYSIPLPHHPTSHPHHTSSSPPPLQHPPYRKWSNRFPNGAEEVHPFPSLIWQNYHFDIIYCISIIPKLMIYIYDCAFVYANHFVAVKHEDYLANIYTEIGSNALHVTELLNGRYISSE